MIITGADYGQDTTCTDARGITYALLLGCRLRRRSCPAATSISAASGGNSDVANSMLAVAFNLAIFGAGVIGAVVISNYDGMALPMVLVVLAVVALITAIAGRRTAFPA